MSRSAPVAAVVLAAGEGTRMRSALPKVLFPLAGRSLLGHAVEAVRGLGPDNVVVVVRHGRDAVVAHLAETAPDVLVAEQDAVPGTGRAAWAGLKRLATDGVDDALGDGTVVVTYGDVPLLTTETLRHLVDSHAAGRQAVTVLTAELPDAGGYGRVLRGPDGSVEAIVEARDATPEQAAVHEFNSGIYAFDASFLRAALSRLTRHNAQGELYLTDVVAIARADGRSVEAVTTDDVRQTEGVNDRVQLADLGRALRDRLLDRWMLAGVSVVDPATTWVDVDVTLEPDATLLPGTQLLGSTSVGAGAVVGPDTTLRDCVVGAGATVVRSHATGASVGAGATVGPFSYLRPGTVLGAHGKIGAFVETKNATIGERAKVPHLSYVGDAEIGPGSNIGAATVFVNYDGADKHRTVVGEEVRIGSDTMLVAPLTIGDGAYTAAGSVIVDDVPPGAMAVGRARQRTIPGWVARRRAGTPSAEAASRALEQRRAEEPGSGDDPSATVSAAGATDQAESTMTPSDIHDTTSDASEEQGL